MRNISEYVFGFQDANEQASLSNLSMEEAGEMMRNEIKNREVNIRQIKTYNMIKNAVWDCVLDLKVPKSEQIVSLALLNEVMVEIKSLIEFKKLNSPFSDNTTRILPGDNGLIQQFEDSNTKHLLKRFSVFSPITLQKTIVKCKSLCLIQD